MDAGSAIDLPSMAKARAMACGSNPRPLPDLMADAVPQKKGSRLQLFGTSPRHEDWRYR